MKWIAMSSSLLLASAALLPTLNAQANNFDLFIDGKKTGKDSFTIKPAKHGFTLASRFQFRVPAGDKTPASSMEMTDELKLTPEYTLIEGSVADQNNYAHHVTYTKNKAGDELDIATYSGTAPVTNFAHIKPAFYMLIPMDAGSAQTLLLGILAHPAGAETYSVFVGDPTGGLGGGGRGPAGAGDPANGATTAAPDAPNTLYESKWFKGTDSGGTLDGKLIRLHTYMLVAGRTRYLMYADENNNVMQLNAPAFKATYVRDKFKLNSTPPAGSAPVPAPVTPAKP